MSQKLSPHSIEAEQAVLGACMNNQRAMFECIDQLTSENFYDINNQLIFDAIVSLANQNKNVDIVGVINLLTVKGKIDNIGKSTIVDIGERFAQYYTLRENISIIKEHSLKRDLIQAGRNVIDLAVSDNSIDEIRQKADAEVFAVLNKEQTTTIISVGEASRRSLTRITERQNKVGLLGITSGYDAIDKITNGFRKGQLIVLAGRPGMAKTAFALNIANRFLKRTNGHVLFFSLEMTAEELSTRLLSMNSLVPSDNLLRSDLDAEQSSRLIHAMGEISNINLTIDEEGGNTLNKIRTRARYITRNKRIDVIIIDHLQIISTPKSKGFQNKTYEIGDVTSGLKAFAKELQIPIILISQINRDTEKRENKRPIMADVRDSGSIEQDADVVMMLYRDDYYNKETPYPNSAEVIFTKIREGRADTVPMHFFPETLRFEDMSENDAAQYKDYVRNSKFHGTKPPMNMQRKKQQRAKPSYYDPQERQDFSQPSF